VGDFSSLVGLGALSFIGALTQLVGQQEAVAVIPKCALFRLWGVVCP